MLKTSKNFLQFPLKTKKILFSAPKINYGFSDHKFFKNNSEKKKQNSDMNQENVPFTHQNVHQKIIFDQPTGEQLIQQNVSLAEYLLKIYKTTGLAIGSYIGTGYLLSGSPLALAHPGFLIFGGLALSIGGIFKFNSIPQVVVQRIKTTTGKI